MATSDGVDAKEMSLELGWKRLKCWNDEHDKKEAACKEKPPKQCE